MSAQSEDLLSAVEELDDLVGHAHAERTAALVAEAAVEPESAPATVRPRARPAALAASRR